MKIFKQIRNFFDYSKEFGSVAAFQIFLNNNKSDALVKFFCRKSSSWVYYRKNSTDFPTLRSLIGRSNLLLGEDFTPEVIVDLGANVGYFSQFYASKYPKARIYAVEASQKNSEVLKKNVEGKDVEIVVAAIWNKNEILKLNIENSFDSFHITNNKDCKFEEVEGITIRDLINRYHIKHIDILKVDIEGAEKQLFQTLDEDIVKRIKLIAIELHSNIHPEIEAEFNSLIKNYSHNRYKVGEYDVVKFEH